MDSLAKGGVVRPPARVRDIACEETACNLLVAGASDQSVGNAKFEDPSVAASRANRQDVESAALDDADQPLERWHRTVKGCDAMKSIL